MHEDVLNKRYNEMEKVIPRIKLTGQWSIDVMREREKINQYVKDNGAFVSKDLVPMSLCSLLFPTAGNVGIKTFLNNCIETQNQVYYTYKEAING